MNGRDKNEHCKASESRMRKKQTLPIKGSNLCESKNAKTLKKKSNDSTENDINKNNNFFFRYIETN